MNTESILAKAAVAVGFKRVRFESNSIPASPNNILAVTIFGDDRGMHQFGAYIFPILKNVFHSSKYIVVCSYPGYESLFPDADEYWSYNDSVLDLHNKSYGLKNKSSIYSDIVRGLNYWFDGQFTQDDIKTIHDGRVLTSDAISRCGGNIPICLPEIPPVEKVNSIIAKELSLKTGKKILIRPKKVLRNIIDKKEINSSISKNFWIHFIESVIGYGFNVVIQRGNRFVDLSRDLPECVHVNTNDELLMMAVARECGCVIDFGGEDSRFAQVCRVPYVSLVERKLYENWGLFEMDDLLTHSFGRKYSLGSFPIVSPEGLHSWNNSVVNPAILLYKSLDTSPLSAISSDRNHRDYNVVRDKKTIKLGTKFIKIQKL